MEHLPHSFLQEVIPLTAWLRLHLESNHYYPTIIPLLSHYYPIIIPLLSHLHELCADLLPTLVPNDQMGWEEDQLRKPMGKPVHPNQWKKSIEADWRLSAYQSASSEKRP